MLWFNVGLRGAIRERESALKRALRKGFNQEVERLLREIDKMKREGAQALATQRR